MAEKLETVDFENVEILRTGTWNGKTFTTEILDQIADAYQATKGALKPPVKLGHDDDQKLLQEDGYPSAGWVENVRRVGSRLLADFAKVPKKVAELLQVGAYRHRSVELKPDMKIGNKTYPLVLTGIAILGADLPAVEGLGDIRGLYQALQLSFDEGVEVYVMDFNAEIELESILASLDQLQARAEGLIKNKTGSPTLRQLQRAYKEGLRRLVGEKQMSLEKVDKTLRADIELIWEETENQIRYRVRDPEDFQDGTFRTMVMPGIKGISSVVGRLKPAKVPEGSTPGSAVVQSIRFDKEVWTMAAAKEWASKHEFEKIEQEVIDQMIETEIRAALGINTDTDLVAAIRDLKTKAEGNGKQAEDMTKLSKELTEAEKRILVLEATNARMAADTAVESYIQKGRLLPRQRQLAIKLALRDATEFEAFVATQPQGLIEFGEKGSENDSAVLVQLEPTPTEVTIAKQMGTWTPEYRLQLIRQKATNLGIELPVGFGKSEDKKT